jgi:hypothetical protein
MKVAFVPISILGGLVAGFIGQKAFEKLWALFDDQEPPDAQHREVAMVKLVAALLLEGAIFRLIRGLFDHSARLGFARVTGVWPGEEAPDRF